MHTKNLFEDAMDPRIPACIFGRKEALSKLINTRPSDKSTSPDAASFDINRLYAGSGKTLLHVACEWGRVEVAQWLIEAGADLEQEDKVGWSWCRVV